MRTYDREMMILDSGLSTQASLRLTLDSNLSLRASSLKGVDAPIIRNYCGCGYTEREMQTNTKFAVAIHALALIELFPAREGGNCLTSGAIAESVQTNPVVIRRVMGALRDRGLVQSQSGPGGGWQQSRPSDRINLREIFEAVQEASIFALPRRELRAECPVGNCLPSVLVSCFKEAEIAMLERLAEVTIADVIESVKKEFSCSWEPGISSEELAGALAAGRSMRAQVAGAAMPAPNGG